jgi:cell division septation protein DedD
MNSMDQMQDTEVTLSTGKLLGIFFAAAIICGIFFSFGYAVGKNSTPAAGVAIMDSSSLATVAANGGAKPAATKPSGPTRACVSSDDTDCVKQEDASAATPSAPVTSTPATDNKPAPELQAQQNDAHPLNAAAPGSGFIVQVAAVSKAEDADALKAALEKKQYPVFVVDNSQSHLFHVQVGPFAEQKDAEAMKNKLAADGYNAILKR